jgi:outer membrane protein OmpA-like peptidoglycan-associated protein/Tol biopolymer transport system component
MFRLFLLVGFCLPVVLASGQSAYTTLKTTNEKAKAAFEEALEYMQERDPARAIRAYEKALKADPKLIDAQLNLAGAHFDAGHWADAEAGFEKALAIDPAYASRASYLLAQAEWEQDKFGEAAEHADAFIKNNPQAGKVMYNARRLAENARFAATAVANPVPFTPRSLGDSINTPVDEYLPSLTADGQTFVFTRRSSNEDFYTAQRQPDGSWAQVKPIAGVNTSNNEGAESISVDGSWLVFTACSRRDPGAQGSCDLYWSQLKNDSWTKPVPFSATINSASWDAQPCISADGKTLFFSSGRPGGQGRYDLWYTTRQPGGKWTAPQNLGKSINTPGDDQTPFLHPDGQTLYFTSDGRPGMGENDIYVVRKNADGTWGTPQNLGYPINTKKGDGALTVSLDGKTAYYATVRPEGRGKNDIYTFDLPEAARPLPVTFVRATVRDAATAQPLVAQVALDDLQSRTEIQTATTKSNGSFLMCLPIGKNYALNVSKTGYLFHSENFNLSEAHTVDKPYELDIALQPLSAGITASPIVLNNIFFETGSAALKPESTVELERLATLLRDNPTMRIQINGHTDNVGNDRSNLSLSDNRARAVQDYLIKIGRIDPARLSAKGFGETVPIDVNDTPAGRARNRRTEFIVL